MELKKKTFEDLIGNFADDAKKALDEILERKDATRNWGSPVATPPVTRPAWAADGADRPVGGPVGDVAGLSGQIARLSELIEKLLPVLETFTVALVSAGNPSKPAEKAAGPSLKA